MVAAAAQSQKALGVRQGDEATCKFGSSTGCYTLYGTLPAPPKLNLIVSPKTVSAGTKLTITAEVEALDRPFDAWAVILFPNNAGIYSMLPGRAPQKGARAVALSVPRLASDSEYLLVNITIPGGIPGGEYIAAAGLFPPGTRPTILEHAEAQAITDYFDRETLTVNP
jgi:hypothetical protein